MKRLVIFLGLLFFSIWSFALDHSGSVSTETWYKVDNPHIITGDVTVATDTTLTIEAGCIVKFSGSQKIITNGILIANGTQTDSIVFTSNQANPAAGDWKLIQFNGSQTGTILNYCRIEYGGGLYAAIQIINSIDAPVISNCFITESANSGIDIGSNQKQDQLAIISDCKITNCTDYPIYTFDPNTCSLISGTMNFANNGTNAIYMGGGRITLSGTWHNTGYPFIIEKTVIIDSSYTITIEPGCVFKFFNGHSVQFFVYGIIQANGTAANHITFTSIDPSSGHWGCFAIWDIPQGSSLTYCDVLYGGSRWQGTTYRASYAGAMSLANFPADYLTLSHLTIQHSDTSGLYVHADAFPTIRNCVITNNKVGLLLASNGVPDFGSSPSEWNDVYNNGGVNVRLHNNFTGSTPQSDVNANYVYWGTDDCGKIGDSIIDVLDGSTNAIVDYNPWLDASHNIVSTTSDTWTGTTDSDWDTGSNWNGGGVPCYMMDIEIPGSATNFPDITATNKCRDLTMDAGAEITIESTGTFNVFGDFEMQANTSGDIPSLVNYGIFSVRNSSTIQDYISAGRWHYLSSPLSEDTAGIFMDMYLYSFDESIYDTNATGVTTAGWVNITDESVSLIPGTGYKVWSYSANPGSKTVSFTEGRPNDGTIELTTTATDQDGNGNIDGKEGWNLVGNPFPSAIDWDNSGWVGKNKFDASIYVYDGSQYLSWNGSTGSITDGVIPAMQAFFVKATDFSPLLKVGNSARVHGASPYKESEVQNLLKLTVYGNGFKDETFINFNENATQGFDSQFDAYKLKGIVEAPQLYSIVGDDILSINVLPGFDNEVTLPLGFEVGAESEYTITAFDLDSFSDGVDAYLEDLQENVIINLSEQDNYMFTANPIDEPQRFVLHFFGSLGKDEMNEISDLSIYSYGNDVFIRNNSNELINANVTVLNLSGQIVWQQDLVFTDLEKIILNSKAGYYIIQVQTEKMNYNKKVILR